MRGILDDPDAAFRSVAVLYQDFLVRCRISRVPGEPLPLPRFAASFAVARAGVDKEIAAGETWQRALALSENLTDDIQGVFLIIAQAAVTGAPCPSDAALARAYGSHSPSRARRLLTYFEEQRAAGRPYRFSRQPRRRLSRSRLRNRTRGPEPAG